MGIRSGAVVVAAGLAVAGVAVLGGRQMLRHQAALARRRIGKPLGEDAPASDRVWRRRFDGPPIDLLVVGDSIAAGLGAHRAKDTLGARVAKGLGTREQRPVRLRTVAVVGSESSALEAQLDALPPGYRPDIAVVIVGGNDVTHRIPIAESVAHLVATVTRLQQLGAAVVVGTCPDLGALRAVPQPLRALGGRLSRQLAAAQAAAVAPLGAWALSLRHAVGSVFVEQPDEMFSMDRFHPSALGYRRTAEAIVPVAAEALRRRASSRG